MGVEMRTAPMMPLTKPFPRLLGGALLCLATAVAQTPPARGAPLAGTTTATAAVAAAITLSDLTPSFTLTGDPGTTVTLPGAVTMRVTTNNRTGYSVTVQAAAATLSPATAGNSDSIPVENLKVKDKPATAYRALSAATAVPVHSQSTRSSSSGDVISNDFQLVVPFVNADSYSVVLNYVASAS